LHLAKEQLRRDLQERDAENRELQASLVDVRRHMDKVQTRQEQDEDGSIELQRRQELLESAQEDKSRLSGKLELAQREAERDKVYHEQALERMTAANAKILFERDQAASEVERLSLLYAKSLHALQRICNAAEQSEALSQDVAVPGLNGTALADPEDADEVRTQIAQVEEALRVQEEENELLKRRIRKLAVA